MSFGGFSGFGTDAVKFRFEVVDELNVFYSHHHTQLLASQRIQRLLKEKKRPEQHFRIRCKFSGQEFPAVDEDGDHIMQ